MSIPSSLPILNRGTASTQQTLRVAGVGAYLLVVSGMSVVIASLHSRGCDRELSRFMLVSSLLSMAAFALLGSLIFLYRPDNRIGWICCLCALGQGSNLTLTMGLECGLTATNHWPGLPYLGWFVYTIMPFIGLLPQFVLLPILYPNGDFLSPRWAQVMFAGIGVGAVTSLALGLLPDFRSLNGVTYALDLDNPFGLSGLPAWWHPVFKSFNTIVLTALGLLGMAAVVVRFRRSVGDERQQMKWLAYFLLTVVTVQFFAFELPGNLIDPGIFYTIWYDLIILAVLLGFPLTVAIAVFKYRLYDIDLIINRTLVYGVLTALVVAIYALIVVGVGRLFHMSSNFAVSLLATGVVAMLFQPARAWLQGWVNRRLYGERDDPAQVLTRLTNQMEAADSGASLLSSLVTTIATSLKLPYVAVWIRGQDENYTLAAEVGKYPEPKTTHGTSHEPVPHATSHGLVPHRARHEVETMPLLHQQEKIGQLVVAPRSPGETLDAADRNLLIAIARLVATTARTVQLTDEVQEARIRTVTAREEERRRLRRDLHDGLGPMLAGQGLKLAAARHLLRTRPAAAEQLLDDVMRQSENTIAEVRRLVYALRPPTLDELGLVEAIREQVDVVGATEGLRISVDAPHQLPEIPAACEVAAFRVVQEALNNVIRHAHAKQCNISLHINGALEVIVEDDGVGMAADTRSGVGLLSMQERVAEVGGVCRIDSGETGGVRVLLTLPIPEAI